MGVVAKPTTKNGDKHMKTKNKYVGLDVHKDTMVVAVADGGREGEGRFAAVRDRAEQRGIGAAEAAHPRRMRARLHHDRRSGEPRGERFEARGC